MITDLEPAVFTAMALGLLTIYLGWRLSHPVFFMGRNPIVHVIITGLLTVVFFVAAFWFPFYLSQGEQVGIYETFIDLMLFGVCPLALIALLGYVLDHVTEWPLMLLVGGAACFAMSVLPVAYYFAADDMHATMEITPMREDDGLDPKSPLTAGHESAGGTSQAGTAPGNVESQSPAQDTDAPGSHPDTPLTSWPTSKSTSDMDESNSSSLMEVKPIGEGREAGGLPANSTHRSITPRPPETRSLESRPPETWRLNKRSGEGPIDSVAQAV